MRESRCPPTDSSASNDREEKVSVSRGSHLLSDICKYLEVSPNNSNNSKNRKSSPTSTATRENVELGLEIEINESLKRVLTTPNSGSDDLLDVTIIRPSESDVTHETTVALNKDEVRDFISLVEQHHQNKLKSGGKFKKVTGDQKKNDIPDHIPSNKQKAVKNGVEESSGVEKPGTPCVCQHCGIMGVLVQSNKTEMKTEIRKDPNRNSRDDKGKEDKEDKKKRRERSPDQPRSSKDFKSQRSNGQDSNSKSQDQLALLREINARIKDLEKRIAVQEENAVPRDYLKHVLYKLLSQYREQQKPQNFKNTGTQYFVESKEKYPIQSSQQTQHQQQKQQTSKKDEKSRRYQVHTLLHTTTAPTGMQRLDIGEPSTTSHNTSTDLGISSGSKSKKQPLYFWGEEVVSPGCDLKTKILNLLDEKMANNAQVEQSRNAQQSKIPIALPEKLPKTADQEIKVERDDNLLFLGKMEEIPPCNIDDYVQRKKIPEMGKRNVVEKNYNQQHLCQNQNCNRNLNQNNSACSVVPESLRPDMKMKHFQSIKPLSIDQSPLKSCDNQQGAKPSCVKPSYIKPSYIKPSFGKASYIKQSYVKQSGINPSGFNPSGFNPSGFNPSGFNPSGSNPSGVNPSGVNASGVNPSCANPSSNNPSYANPSYANPSYANPSYANPSSANPSSANPSSANPSHANPSCANPSYANPSYANPSSINPPYANPSSMKPQTVGNNNVLNVNLQYPFDPKRTFDDTTFRKNIDAHKERLKEKPTFIEKFFNNYTSQSGSTESKASMEYILQKLKNNNQVMESNGKGTMNNVADDNCKMNHYEKLASSIIKEKMMCGGFRGTKAVVQETTTNTFSVPVDVTYVNPKITQWSEESTASEDKYMKFMKPNARKETLPVETKESLIYKLEFLKNLAKHKSADQSKVLNKIWTQAKKTAKSKNDAVFIKIPFKSVNAVEPRNNVIEMQLTLEQLETVVKSVKVNDSNTKIVAKYKSSSEIDLGQRRHEEIRKANMEVLNKRRNFSAKTARNKK